MIIYQQTAGNFRRDVDDNRIVDVLRTSFIERMGWCPEAEVGSWTNSLRAMESVVRNSGISDDCGVLIEYKIPLTSRRIDFVVAGEAEDSSKNFVVIELKQWQRAGETSKDGVVTTAFRGGVTETTHPSYQAQSYRVLVQEYNENVWVKGISLHSCAYLHNYTERQPEPLKASVYEDIVRDSPLFFKDDARKLQEFLRTNVGCGRGMEILYDIQNGKIRPSKKLIDHVCGMFKGNPDFVLIDNQKVAYEKALELARNSDEKTVLIVKGGPGTGKSVISVNLIGALLRKKKNTVFVAPSAAFREILIQRLARERTKTVLKGLFKGSSSFVDCGEDDFDVAIVDEAHRLKNGTAYQYRGENQVRDIVQAARCSIMFVDDDQRVRPEDIGSVSTITEEAKAAGARVFEIELEAQFRCSGADGYLNWLDHVLHLRETANFDGWGGGDFDFRVFSNPNELRKAIGVKQEAGYYARMLAGYAWPWTSEKKGNSNGQVNDVSIKAFGFAMPWNSRSSRSTWAIDESGVEQVGCIHTSQGLEFDYVGVLVGKDLRFDGRRGEFFVDWNSYKDRAGKKGLRKKPGELSKLVRNIYKVLMTRGMKGCYIFCEDQQVEDHFRNLLPDINADSGDTLSKMAEGESGELVPFINALPLIPLRSVATASYEDIDGNFPWGRDQIDPDELYPIDGGPFAEDRFLVRVEGDSMEPDIPEGSVCKFRLDPGGSRNGKIVLCVMHDQTEGTPVAVIKRYHSVRAPNAEGVLFARQIVLSSINPKHPPIVLTEGDDLRILGVFEAVVQESEKSEGWFG